MNITIPEYKKEILSDYMKSFSDASIIRYDSINFLNLYLFNAPLYFKDMFDFQFNNLDIQSMFEFYFMDKENLSVFNKALEGKEPDLSIKYINNHNLFHFFSINETILLISKLSNEPTYSNLWVLFPNNTDENRLIEMEEDIYLFFEEVNTRLKNL